MNSTRPALSLKQSALFALSIFRHHYGIIAALIGIAFTIPLISFVIPALGVLAALPFGINSTNTTTYYFLEQAKTTVAYLSTIESFAFMVLVAAIYILGLALYILLYSWFALGATYIILSIRRGMPWQWQNIKALRALILTSIITSFMYRLYISLGMLLLIVPGVIWYLTYRFFWYLIVDGQTKPLQALQESAQLTTGYRWQLLGFYAIPFAIGVLLGIPFEYCISHCSSPSSIALLSSTFGIITSFLNIVVMLAEVDIYQQLRDLRAPVPVTEQLV